MKTEKVSPSLDAELLAEARRHAEGSSLRRQVQIDRQREFLADWESEFGAIPGEALTEMVALWPD